MDENLQKSLAELIDETLFELDELKKSRFSASEIKIEGPGDGIDGKPSDGSLEKEEDKKEDDKEEKKDEDKDMDKAEDKKKKDDEDEEAEDMDKKEDKKEEEKEDEHEKKEKDLASKLLDMHKEEVKKSREEIETLAKSYVDEKVKPLEDKLSTILELVNQLADAPVAPKGATARTVPLFKSADGGTEPLSKSEITGKLLDLKKSGTKVDSLDVTKADLGQDLEEIVKKYKIS